MNGGAFSASFSPVQLVVFVSTVPRQRATSIRASLPGEREERKESS
jgi:hypothetical protein